MQKMVLETAQELNEVSRAVARQGRQQETRQGCPGTAARALDRAAREQEGAQELGKAPRRLREELLKKKQEKRIKPDQETRRGQLLRKKNCASSSASIADRRKAGDAAPQPPRSRAGQGCSRSAARPGVSGEDLQQAARLNAGQDAMTTRTRRSCVAACGATRLLRQQGQGGERCGNGSSAPEARARATKGGKRQGQRGRGGRAARAERQPGEDGKTGDRQGQGQGQGTAPAA